MNIRYESDQEDFRPRVIVWEFQKNNRLSDEEQFTDEPNGSLSAQENMLVLESIARIAKPIIVLTGSHLLTIESLFEFVQYGHALGLKMIIETPPEDINQEVIRQYSVFGPRIFRLLIDSCIQEDMDTRFRRTPEYYTLDRALRLLKSGGFEIHLGTTVKSPDIRNLAFEHDYAYRRSARGLYCHLNFDDSKHQPGKRPEYTEENIEQFIEAIAKMKRYSPDSMYFSPQCVQYGFVGSPESNHEGSAGKEKAFEWKHYCLGGKRFAYIKGNGKVQICSGLNAEAGDLRMTGFDFQEVWESSELFRMQREDGTTCAITREYIHQQFPESTAQKPQPEVEYLP